MMVAKKLLVMFFKQIKYNCIVVGQWLLSFLHNLVALFSVLSV